MPALPRSVMPWRTSFFYLVNELSFIKTFLLALPDFFELIMGHYHGVILFVWQPKHVSDGIAALRQSNRRCRRVCYWCRPCVRFVLFFWMNVRHHAAPRHPIFCIDVLIMSIIKFYFVSYAAKTKCCNDWISLVTKLAMLALPRSWVPWRTPPFLFLNEFLFIKIFLWRHLLRIDNVA
jgi:hypothetical protein